MRAVSLFLLTAAARLVEEKKSRKDVMAKGGFKVGLQQYQDLGGGL